MSKHKKATIIDGSGKYLMPGLVDMHVHLPEENKIEKLLRSNIAAGVTHIRVMNSNVAQADLKEKLKKDSKKTTPIIHYSQLVRRNEIYNEAQADSLMKQVKVSGMDFVKLLSLSDEATFDNLMIASKKHNVTVCGHYPVYQFEGQSTMMDIEKVLKSNFKSIEHLAGYTWLQDKNQIDKALQLTKQYGVYNCPTLDWDIMSGDLQFPDGYKSRITYQFLPKTVTQNWDTDYLAAIEKAGGSEKVIEARDKAMPGFELKQKILKRLYENGCFLLLGSDAGNSFQADGFNMYEEMVNWKNAGIDNYTILKSATLTPAQFFNMQNNWGTVETGKNAELIILTKNPLEDIKNITTIEMTILGEKIYDNKELIEAL